MPVPHPFVLSVIAPAALRGLTCCTSESSDDAFIAHEVSRVG